MPSTDINMTAVLVAAVAAMVVGSVWYMPAVMGNVWMKAIGKKQDELGKPGPAMFGMFIGALVAAYVLAHFVDYTAATTASEGAVTGFWIWLGFVATMTYASVGFEGKPWSYWLVTNGNQLITLAVMGAILANWN